MKFKSFLIISFIFLAFIWSSCEDHSIPFNEFVVTNKQPIELYHASFFFYRKKDKNPNDSLIVGTIAKVIKPGESTDGIKVTVDSTKIVFKLDTISDNKLWMSHNFIQLKQEGIKSVDLNSDFLVVSDDGNILKLGHVVEDFQKNKKTKIKHKKKQSLVQQILEIEQKISKNK